MAKTGCEKALGYRALRGVGIEETPGGVKVDMRLYVRPGDDGNLVVGDCNAPFAVPEEAVGAFLTVLSSARKAARKRAGKPLRDN